MHELHSLFKKEGLSSQVCEALTKLLGTAISEQHLNRFTRAFKARANTFTQLKHCSQCSVYFTETIHRYPDQFLSLIIDEDIGYCVPTQAISKETINRQFEHFFSTKNNVDSGLENTEISDTDWHDAVLRRLRQMFMLRIIWRDINRLSSLEDTTRELTLLAEYCMHAALDFHSRRLIDCYGMPQNKRGEAQDFYIIGMGKLGAYELNLSSDIDLIFCYPEPGYCQGNTPTTIGRGKPEILDNQHFFSQLGKRFIHSLDAVTQDGFVFRVDMRLRPYGQSGSLVSHFAALEEYYHTQGREWERYAMVKARIVASTDYSGQTNKHAHDLMLSLNHFTYRKYIDFSVIDALRHLKVLIQKEVRRRKLSDDLKLGAGGIREIEFIAQAFQLIRGGRDTELQTNRVQEALPILERLHCIPQGAADKLLQAYTFLRCSEHAIQAYQDKQTQKLPIDSKPQMALYKAMGFASWQAYLGILQSHRNIVDEIFQELIQEKRSGKNNFCAINAALDLSTDIWRSACEHGDDNPELNIPKPLWRHLVEFAQSSFVDKLRKDSRERLDDFMPCLLLELRERETADVTFVRLLPLLHATARRSAYLVLLIENPAALSQLVTLISISQQIADGLSRNPVLLDEFLDTQNLYYLPEQEDLENELQRMMLRIEPSDLEQQMETLRYFKLSHALRITACEVSQTLPLMKVSDYLTRLAEVIVRACMHIAWHATVARHGFPSTPKARETSPNDNTQPDFLILGYGKLGGIEMNHGSDLDLVFIHDADINGYSDGERSLDNHTFYTRMGQKIIHIMNTQTASGRLYEIDMRLRPSGNSGLLTSSFNAFEKYQNDSAWTWEHQALLRARAIAGSAELRAKFTRLKTEILCRQRDHAALAQDIVSMRKKMRAQLGSGAAQAGFFDLKHDEGGIVDVEFMVQYMALAWSHQYPSIVAYTDNIRILEALYKSQVISSEELEKLRHAYKCLRQELHRLSIENLPKRLPSTALAKVRRDVIDIWQKLFPDHEKQIH